MEACRRSSFYVTFGVLQPKLAEKSNFYPLGPNDLDRCNE